MKYGVKLTPAAAAFLVKLHPDNKRLVKISLEELSQKPYSGKELQEELAGFLSCKLKRFRIIYKVNDSEKLVYVYFIGHRREVYELFHDFLKLK